MKKKIFVALGFVSICVCVYGFYRYRVASWFLFLLLGLYFIFYDKIKLLFHSPSSPKEKEDVQKPVNTISKSYNGFRVAGVTFSNEDGTERQYLLKKLYFRDKPFDGDLVVELDRYLWEEKPAYYVKVNGYTVGSVEASAVYYFEKNSGRPLKNEIKVHFGNNGIYSAEISGKFLDVTE